MHNRPIDTAPPSGLQSRESTAAAAALAKRASDARDLSIAFALMLTAFALFVVMDTSAKWLVLGAIPALQVAFMRFLVHLGWVIAIYLPREGTSLFRSKLRKLQVLRGTLLFCSTALNFTALKYLPLAVTISIFFTGPLIVCLLSIPILGERVGVRRLSAVAVGFIGVLVILQPWDARFDWHVIFSIGATLCAASYFVLSRLIRGADGNGTTQFHASLVGTLGLAPFALDVWVWPPSATHWFLLVLLGSFGMLGHSMVTRAHEFAEASVLAPTVYSQMLYVTFVSWFVFGSLPAASTVAGSLIIIASGLYVWWRERSLVRS